MILIIYLQIHAALNSMYKPRKRMEKDRSKKWHDGLVEAFPVPRQMVKSSIQKMEASFNDLRISDTLPPADPKSIFPFFSLPAEIRNRIYELVLLPVPEQVRSIFPARRLPTSLFLASSRTHREASYIFYTAQMFRIFPLQEFRPLPALMELPAPYASLLTQVELVLGPSFTAPPRSLRVTIKLARALKKLQKLICLRLFVALDPSRPPFCKIKSAQAFPDFAGKLVKDLLVAMPQVEVVSIDRNPSVERDGPLLTKLRIQIEEQGREIRWDDKAALEYRLEPPPSPVPVEGDLKP